MYGQDSTTVALYDLLHESIARGHALVVDYATAGVTVKRRVIFPQSLFAATHGDCIQAHDSLRGGVITLRLDRLVSVQTMDDAVAFLPPLVVTAPVNELPEHAMQREWLDLYAGAA